ncbi:MAG TPA: 16S rRNA pseudouridine(516) synthase [Methylomirabilota bacterium]|nr:16S rRNA pseudouridine(516) synthase [Methylomirabilota bacterium]
MTQRRLDQILSRHGYCSRSEARHWIGAGRVRIGETLAQSPEQKADPAVVRIDGEPVEGPGGLVALLHKPAGYVCSHDESEGPTVFDLLPARWLRRNPPLNTVGRLDRDTTGVLLLTDLGQLIQQWTSPRRKVPKVYDVTLDRELDPGLIEVFASGRLLLDGEATPCLPARLELVAPCQARLHLIEGRYHQVKRMFASQGWRVERLHRSAFGEFTLEGLAPGQWRLLPAQACLDRAT